ncbi:hypothetical protein LCGC14_0905450 [marine sediment metagenome]|uniref:Radical SAM core domain-containing protein n=1 Tax=marine sediment metagenome TaxID=412755 RepID=A0A0F9S227_9ZZZZ
MNLNEYEIEERKHLKFVKSSEYNYIFNSENGFFTRWGKTKEVNPQFSPFGPELLDIEISTICSSGCNWCYKSNTSTGKNMSFSTFKKILNKIPRNLTQIAFGIGDIDANPDLWKIFDYCKSKNIIPNITINGNNLNRDLAKNLTKYCGAVAVSHYTDDTCFDAVILLVDEGLNQVNIHKLVAKETLDSCYEVLNLISKDPRLSRLNAIIFLSLKNKGKRNSYHKISRKEFSELVLYAMSRNVRMGFDSCSANKVLAILKDKQNYQMIEMMSEPCESSCFSLYINVEGIAYPCSFLEGENGFEGIDLLNLNNFFKGVWFNVSIKKFREKLVRLDRNCPHFNI